MRVAGCGLFFLKQPGPARLQLRLGADARAVHPRAAAQPPGKGVAFRGARGPPLEAPGVAARLGLCRFRALAPCFCAALQRPPLDGGAESAPAVHARRRPACAPPLRPFWGVTSVQRSVRCAPAAALASDSNLDQISSTSPSQGAAPCRAAGLARPVLLLPANPTRGGSLSRRRARRGGHGARRGRAAGVGDARESASGSASVALPAAGSRPLRAVLPARPTQPSVPFSPPPSLPAARAPPRTPPTKPWPPPSHPPAAPSRPARRRAALEALTFEHLRDFSRETNWVSASTGPHVQGVVALADNAQTDGGTQLARTC